MDRQGWFTGGGVCAGVVGDPPQTSSQEHLKQSLKRTCKNNRDLRVFTFQKLEAPSKLG
jgi:hypothetical protein